MTPARASGMRRYVVPLALSALLVGVPYVLLILVGWAGLGKDLPGLPPPPAGQPQAQKVSASGQATQVLFLSPKDGETLPGSRVRVRVRVNGKLAPKSNVVVDRTDGLVHLHFQLDAGRYDTPEHSDSALMEFEKSAGSYSGAVVPRVTYRGLAPGSHVLRVELVHNDHEPTAGVSAAGLTFSTK
jgi:hypothetical protein